MLQDLLKLHSSVDTLLIFADSDLLKDFVQAVMRKVYKVDKTYAITVDTAKQLGRVMSDMLTAPMLGEKWLVTINIDNIETSAVEKILNSSNGNSMTLLFSEKYIKYRNLKGSKKFAEALKAKTVQDFYLKNLRSMDIDFLHRSMLYEHQQMPDSALRYFMYNYTYNVNKVFQLIYDMQQGLEINTKHDIVENIGLGGVTVDSMLIDLLRVEPTTPKKKAFAIRKYMNLVNDLATNYSYVQIYQYMYSSLKDILMFKEILLRGMYRKSYKIVPAWADIKKIKKLRRFEDALMGEISIQHIICLIQLFNNVKETEVSLYVPTDKSPLDAESKLMYIIYNYIGSWKDV